MKKGFTLTEILIALSIMGLIAIFTIPKVLNTTKNSDTENWKRSIKQVANEIQAGYSRYRLNNRTVPTTFTASDLTPYLNYVKIITTATLIDAPPCGGGTINCSQSNKPCVQFKNGAIAQFDQTESFNGTGSLNAFKIKVDPDGKVTGGAGDEGVNVILYMYYNGRVKDRVQIDTGTTSSNWTDNPNASCAPSWWGWN